jgi:hypothetical protein
LELFKRFYSTKKSSGIYIWDVNRSTLEMQLTTNQKRAIGNWYEYKLVQFQQDSDKKTSTFEKVSIQTLAPNLVRSGL